MQMRMLGSSALSISHLGFGCMSLGEDQASNEQLIHAAIDQGINFFDTADLYQHGRNEASLGKALQGKRQQVIIASKVGNQWKADGSGWDWNPRKEYILQSVDESLRRLQTEYLDLYQLHGGTMDDNIGECIEAFEQLKQKGKIRYYGISSIRPNVVRAYAYRSSIVSVMMQYSLLDRRPAEACLDVLSDQQVGVLARGCLAGGLLTGKTAKSYLNYAADMVAKASATVEKISGKQRSPTGTALQFAWQQPAICSAVVGIRTMQQLEAAVSAEAAPALTPDEYNLLQACIPLNYYSVHR